MKENYLNPNLKLSHSVKEGLVAWRSPSNIALVKYWGKYGMQLPKNASLSMTLSKSYTESTISYAFAKEEPRRVFLFEGKKNDAFAQRIWKFLDALDLVFPFLRQVDLLIETQNSFPHSAGIASSASAMSALALCLVELEQKLFGSLQTEEEFFRKASYVARLGSGSASRSVYGDFTIWGESLMVQADSDAEIAVPLSMKVHDRFKKLYDSILIVDRGQKEVSSSLGHSLMNHHPYAENRLKQADAHLKSLTMAMKSGDQDAFIKVVESEALSLHALMMSSDPWFMLMKPDTLKILQKIKSYREKTGHFICFTLDAGPNVHLIYGDLNKKEIEGFINDELKVYCHLGQMIFDGMGSGPQKLD